MSQVDAIHVDINYETASVNFNRVSQFYILIQD